ncbi:cytosolic regulator Pianissimo, putative [Anopheles sinensis]|uniref:Cytosolic regulator Pianissimo, putative n=1 Tax=Anopheles sinensis TaxID=74873 RepID=A0A084VGI2_ANOSI|nr:cytosolic regulator Pianissimo, putative [Anopheles sinensis]
MFNYSLAFQSATFRSPQTQGEKLLLKATTIRLPGGRLASEPHPAVDNLENGANYLEQHQHRIKISLPHHHYRTFMATEPPHQTPSKGKRYRRRRRPGSVTIPATAVSRDLTQHEILQLLVPVGNTSNNGQVPEAHSNQPWAGLSRACEKAHRNEHISSDNHVPGVAHVNHQETDTSGHRLTHRVTADSDDT